jgi:acetyl esterase/lipase
MVPACVTASVDHVCKPLIAATMPDMLTGSLLFFVAVFALFLSWNALRPPHNDLHPMRRPPWILVLLTAEIVPVHLAAIAIVTVLAWSTGGLDSLQGRIAIVLLVPSVAMYLVVQARAWRVWPAVRTVLTEAGVPLGRTRIRLADAVRGWPYRVPDDVERIDDIVYAPGLRLDVYRAKGHEGAAPALLQIHGGSWSGGSRRQQARPLMHELARHGWVCVAVSYPLVPEATFPEQLVALKQAVGWMRTHGADLGVDPDRIAVTGGSAGGHLAALVALTSGDSRYQPGFASVDTSVAAAVPMYGIFDLLNRQQTRDDFEVIPKALLKALPEEAEELYREASPLDRIHRDAPPFLVIHGAADSLVAPAESELFVRALRAVSAKPVVHIEIPGATHSFDAVPSVRTQFVVAGIAGFLEAVMAGTTAPAPDDVT